KMREIDPMREPSEALLSSALHRLASASERNAPVSVEAGLMQKYRQHHQRRRRVRMMKAGGIAAAILLIAIFTVVLVSPGRVQHSHSVQPHQEVSPVMPSPEANTGNTQTSTSPARSSASVLSRAEDTREGDRFIALPSYDPAVPAGDLKMVRLEVTGSDLRLLGAPVAGDLSERVTADFITDRDGTPYAVRLVR